MARDVLGQRFLEVLAVLLLGVATVGTAWCGLQSSLWNGTQDDLTAATATARLEANRAYGKGIQTLAYDSNLLIDYAAAVRAGDTTTQEFLKGSLMRPAMLPFLEQWQQQLGAGDEVNLLTDEAYLATLSKDYDQATATADQLAVEATRAGSASDSYVVTTVLLAMALFFAGVTSSFKIPSTRLALLVGSVLCVAFAAARLIDLPVAETTNQLVPWLT